MTDVKKLIERVVEESGKTIEEITSKMAQRKEKTHGLLSDYGALYAVAKEFGIDLSSENTVVVNISDVTPQKSINVAGKVKTVFSPREFTRKDKSTGKFASIILLDNTGEIRLVLWDQNTDLTKKVHVGDTILVRNGYAKDNNGTIEVHAGSLTNLAVNPMMEFDLPEIEESLVKIKDITKDNQSINLICRITSYYPKQEFERNNGSVGARASFIAEDETAKIRVVLWDKNADFPMKSGEYVKLENTYARDGLNNDLEVQAGSQSRIVKTDKTLNLPKFEEKIVQPKISEIKPDMNSLKVFGRVLVVYPIREFSKGVLASIIIGDETGTIRAVLWDEKAKDAEKIKVGDAIRIENTYSKTNLNAEPELHVGKYGSITVDSEADVPSLSVVQEVSTPAKKIMDLDIADKRVKVSGTVVDLDDEKPLFFMTCPGCGKKAQNLGTSWFCEMCGDVDPNINVVASITVEDETGNIRAVLFGDNAEKLIDLNIDEAMNLIGAAQDETAPLKEVKDTIINKNVTLVGRVKYNDYSDRIELIVDEIH